MFVLFIVAIVIMSQEAPVEAIDKPNTSSGKIDKPKPAPKPKNQSNIRPPPFLDVTTDHDDQSTSKAI